MTAPVARAAVPIAEVVRGGVVESVHLGHVVALADDGSVAGALGDAGAEIFARSSLKPLQAVAMVRAGLDLEPELLALASSSHNGERIHVHGARRILAGAGLDESALQNTPDYPLNDDAALELRCAGTKKAPIYQNCSGKHSAMLATCAAAGWSVDDYRAPEHPLQLLIRSVVEELTGEHVQHTTVDGCGAPLFSCTVRGLARAFAAIATAPPGTAEHRVAEAIRHNPQFLGGIGRDVTQLVGGIPGFIAKDGAEGVYAGAMPDGRSVALKVLDGSQRPRPVVMAVALRYLGVEAEVLDDVSRVPVLGHGEPVGEVRAVALERPAGAGDHSVAGEGSGSCVPSSRE
ncbi:MAG TPA: asparaginase [Actinomycetales bacterium]|nr:asparaginase [Actinomycetales bacterium]